MGGRTDRRTDAGKDNTPSAWKDGGKNQPQLKSTKRHMQLIGHPTMRTKDIAAVASYMNKQLER